MTNEIKEAIITVINTTYKYEAPKAFETVKRAGYDIYKVDGRWVVRDRQTWKTIRLTQYGTYLCVGNRRVKAENANKVDIINYLKTPVNRTYYAVCDQLALAWNTPTRRKMNDLKWAKQRVADCEKEINKLAKALEAERQRYVKLTRDLCAERVACGLPIV